MKQDSIAKNEAAGRYERQQGQSVNTQDHFDEFTSSYRIDLYFVDLMVVHQ